MSVLVYLLSSKRRLYEVSLVSTCAFHISERSLFAFRPELNMSFDYLERSALASVGEVLTIVKKRKRSAVRKFLRVLRFSARLILITCNGQSDRYRNTGRVGCCRRETPYRRASVIILCSPLTPQKGREGNMSRFPFSAALGMTI